MTHCLLKLGYTPCSFEYIYCSRVPEREDCMITINQFRLLFKPTPKLIKIELVKFNRGV